MSQPLCYTVAEACALARTGRTTLYQAIRRKELVARKLGKKTLILEEDLRQWIVGLPPLAPSAEEV